MPLILVADDDAKVCRWLRMVLEMEGYRVVEATDGRQAMRTIQRGAPDLVMLDIHLPAHDGLETILRLHSRQVPVKVLAVSGQAVQGYDILKIAAIFGAHGTLAQPFSVDRLLLGVRALVGPVHPHLA
ncbi:MAG: response regulator [Nitrospira sp.]|nr:response regulator [Nitrospira sp.]MCW5787153.1 response regulator [Nitrospira sp.]MDR4475200.1 response regulator [Nitrospira sp.]